MSEEKLQDNESGSDLGQVKKKTVKKAGGQSKVKLTLDPEEIEKIKAEAKAEAKSEIMAELRKDLGISTDGGSSGGSAEDLLRRLVKAQRKSFKELNPTLKKVSYELVGGTKLLKIQRKQDGTKISTYIGRINKHDHAKSIYEKAKASGNIDFR